MAKVAVLGCGPAGLLACHAAVRAGHSPVVFSRAVPSAIGGAQYLHQAIPGITKADPDGVVEFVKYGNEHGYAKKVYNDPYAKTSWYDYEEGPHNIWNMRRAYDKLWKKYSPLITDLKLDHAAAASLCRTFPLVMNTVPMIHLCGEDHLFESQDVWIVYGKMHERGEDRIIYDGTGDFPWYRWSYIFGWVGIEYGQLTKHELDATHITKPLVTTCECLPEMVRLGRYGRWQKGQLIHHAYEGAVHALQRL